MAYFRRYRDPGATGVVSHSLRYILRHAGGSGIFDGKRRRASTLDHSHRCRANPSSIAGVASPLRRSERVFTKLRHPAGLAPMMRAAVPDQTMQQIDGEHLSVARYGFAAAG